MASPYSLMNLAQKLGSPSTIDFLLGGNRIPYNNLEAQPTKGLGAPKWPQKVSWPQKALTTKGHNHRLGSNDPRVTSSRTFTSTNPRGESKPMQQNAMARTHEVLKSFTLKFQQSNKCLWGNKRGRTMEEKHQELQDQDLLGSPHLEERWIGGNVDLDLLSLFPQRYARIMGGIER